MQTASRALDQRMLLRARGDERLRISALCRGRVPCQPALHTSCRTHYHHLPVMMEEMGEQGLKLPAGKQKLRSEAGFEPGVWMPLLVSVLC